MECREMKCRKCGEILSFDHPIKPADGTGILLNVGYWCYSDFIMKTFPQEIQQRMREIQTNGEKIHFLFENYEWKEQYIPLQEEVPLCLLQ